MLIVFPPLATVFRRFRKMVCSFECLAAATAILTFLGSVYLIYKVSAENPVVAIIMAAAIIISALLFFFAIKGEPEKTIT